SHTIVRLLPEPCVCQMIPPSRRFTCSCAARTPKYWFCRQVFLMPASETKKSWINSRKRGLLHSCRSERSSGFSTELGFLPGQIILFWCFDSTIKIGRAHV